MKTAEVSSQKTLGSSGPTIGKLPLPARYAAKDHFNTAYAATQRAAETLIQSGQVSLPEDLTPDQVNEWLRLLNQASCAVRAIKNILDGNPVPRRGE